jgi:aminoglycoside 6'-N-acetyltransferase I
MSQGVNARATLTIRAAEARDADAWLRLRGQLWPEGSESAHRAEIQAFFAGKASEPEAVLVAEAREMLVGLAELSIRPCAQGCETDRVAYLEGWYVVPEERRKGVGRALVRAAETWGRAAGCVEFASDTSPGNLGAIRAHVALGFENVGTALCFRKKL